MKSPRRALSLRLAVVAAVTALTMLAVAAPASQAKVTKLKGSTTVTPSAAVNAFLSAQGVSVAHTGTAKAEGSGFTFPIGAGVGNTKTFNGVLAHSGGLKFTKGGKSYVTRRFVAVHVRKQAYVLAQVPGLKGGCAKARKAVRLVKRIARKHPRVARKLVRTLRRYCKGGRVILLGRLRNLKKDVSGKSATLSADIRLSKEAARLINKSLGTNVPAGSPLGSAVSHVTAGS
jgi:hypothetical protein